MRRREIIYQVIGLITIIMYRRAAPMHSSYMGAEEFSKLDSLEKYLPAAYTLQMKLHVDDIVSLKYNKKHLEYFEFIEENKSSIGGTKWYLETQRVSSFDAVLKVINLVELHANQDKKRIEDGSIDDIVDKYKRSILDIQKRYWLGYLLVSAMDCGDFVDRVSVQNEQVVLNIKDSSAYANFIVNTCNVLANKLLKKEIIEKQIPCLHEYSLYDVCTWISQLHEHFSNRSFSSQKESLDCMEAFLSDKYVAEVFKLFIQYKKRPELVRKVVMSSCRKNQAEYRGSLVSLGNSKKGGYISQNTPAQNIPRVHIEDANGSTQSLVSAVVPAINNTEEVRNDPSALDQSQYSKHNNVEKENNEELLQNRCSYYNDPLVISERGDYMENVSSDAKNNPLATSSDNAEVDDDSNKKPKSRKNSKDESSDSKHKEKGDSTWNKFKKTLHIGKSSKSPEKEHIKKRSVMPTTSESIFERDEAALEEINRTVNEIPIAAQRQSKLSAGPPLVNVDNMRADDIVYQNHVGRASAHYNEEGAFPVMSSGSNQYEVDPNLYARYTDMSKEIQRSLNQDKRSSSMHDVSVVPNPRSTLSSAYRASSANLFKPIENSSDTHQQKNQEEKLRANERMVAMNSGELIAMFDDDRETTVSDFSEYPDSARDAHKLAGVPIQYNDWRHPEAKELINTEGADLRSQEVEKYEGLKQNIIETLSSNHGVSSYNRPMYDDPNSYRNSMNDNYGDVYAQRELQQQLNQIENRLEESEDMIYSQNNPSNYNQQPDHPRNRPEFSYGAI
ncbi:hypothetical protein NEIRO03_0110 [Nematocida sp. AWRm78]|nr:hypothetical protein NEIRO02_0077 [Nematocida sp. AWRm79]KAI5182426.1 hypothetical protein NEIRO03_0110 [Nematocida sp. AWRm78]